MQGNDSTCIHDIKEAWIWSVS